MTLFEAQTVADIQPTRDSVVSTVHDNLKRTLGSVGAIIADYALFGGPIEALAGLPIPVISDIVVKAIAGIGFVAAAAPILPWIVGGVAVLGLISGVILFSRGLYEARSLNKLIIDKARDGDITGYFG